MNLNSRWDAKFCASAGAWFPAVLTPSTPTLGVKNKASLVTLASQNTWSSSLYLKNYSPLGHFLMVGRNPTFLALKQMDDSQMCPLSIVEALRVVTPCLHPFNLQATDTILGMLSCLACA